MTDPERSERPPDAAEGDEEEIASTPFDNPYFLPVVLGAFALWLFYDGFLNFDQIEEWRTTEGEAWYVEFNRIGAGVAGLLAAWFGARAWRERREAGSD